MARPDLLILGQVTVDHVVPAEPGPWFARLGGNALYAAAGARLWLDPARIGLVWRRGRGFAFDVEGLLAGAGIEHVRRRAVEADHLTEWIVYDRGWVRRCLPKNEGLLHIGAEGEPGDVETYLDYLLRFTPEAADIPGEWLPAGAAHLAPQARDRHPAAIGALRARVGFLSADPSPFLTRPRDAAGIGRTLAGLDALVPSALEVGHLAGAGWEAAALALRAAGFPEVVIKRGADPVVVASAGGTRLIAPPPAAVADPTGAGDGFGGAYAACRLLGCDPVEAAKRAIVAAGMVVETSGADAALALDPREAARRRAAMD